MMGRTTTPPGEIMTAATDTHRTAAMLARSYAMATWGDEDGIDYATALDDDRPQIRCGHCAATHHAVEMVKACHAGDTIRPCSDLVEIWTEDGPQVVECGEDAAFHHGAGGSGFRCTAGHAWVDMATRNREGWEYADDDHDAAVILAGGRDYRPGGPHTVIDPTQVAKIMTSLP
jgi:hypothetical protein